MSKTVTKKAKKSSRKMMEQRSKSRYHFRVMEHYTNLSNIQKAQSAGKKNEKIN